MSENLFCEGMKAVTVDFRKTHDEVRWEREDACQLVLCPKRLACPVKATYIPGVWTHDKCKHYRRVK